MSELIVIVLEYFYEFYAKGNMFKKKFIRVKKVGTPILINGINTIYCAAVKVSIFQLVFHSKMSIVHSRSGWFAIFRELEFLALFGKVIP